MTMPRLDRFLTEHKVSYRTVSHPSAYTALETAQRAHVEGRSLVKTVIIKVDGIMAMMILPAHHVIDLADMPDVLGCEQVELAREYEFKDKFAGCEVGAQPPFGHLFGMPVFLDSELAKCNQICFCAGQHNELLEMAFDDFVRLAKPTLITSGFAHVSGHHWHEQPRMGKLRH